MKMWPCGDGDGDGDGEGEGEGNGNGEGESEGGGDGEGDGGGDGDGDGDAILCNAIFNIPIMVSLWLPSLIIIPQIPGWIERSREPVFINSTTTTL